MGLCLLEYGWLVIVDLELDEVFFVGVFFRLLVVVDVQG